MSKAARLLTVLAALCGFALAQPALAGSGGDISTPAWSNHDLALYYGPGNEFAVKTVLPGGARISVDRCSRLWCQVHAGRTHGYAFLYALSFGAGPNSIIWPGYVKYPGVGPWGWRVISPNPFPHRVFQGVPPYGRVPPR